LSGPALFFVRLERESGRLDGPIELDLRSTRLQRQCYRATNSLPTYGGAEVSNLRMICPSGQIAVGIFGHAGSAIDQLGLICDNWVSPAAGSAAGNTLGQKIVAHAKAHMGQCFTDANGHTQQGACPPTGNKDTDTGPGECTYLVQSAVVASGGQPPNYNVTKIPGTDTDQKQPLAISGLPYTWGDPVNPPYQPGDIIQLTITRFVGPDNTHNYQVCGTRQHDGCFVYRLPTHRDHRIHWRG
jgi:hypothetical protein